MGAPYRAHFLRQEREFASVFDTGGKAFVEGFMLVSAPGSGPCPRLGVVANRKRGKAHDRNAFRRRAKGWFWRNRETIRPATDFVLVATLTVKDQPRQTLYRRLEELFRKSGALGKS